jgi:MFS family permease
MNQKYYGTIQTITRVFDADAIDGAESGGTPQFDYKSIFISSSAEILGLLVVIHTIDTVGRVNSQVISFLVGGVCVFSVGILASSSNWVLLTVLSFFARACMMAGSCSTWVTTAEIYSTEIRTSGHSVANALGRIGAFSSPYLVSSRTPITTVGVIMLVVNLVTATSAYQLPETKGVEIGHVTDNNQETVAATATAPSAVRPIV